VRNVKKKVSYNECDVATTFYEDGSTTHYRGWNDCDNEELKFDLEAKCSVHGYV
jgi:hypothetical protein